MTLLFDSEAMQRVLSRMAHEMIEQNDAREIALVGLQTRGVFLARRLADKIREVTGAEIPTGTLDISMYRDDLNLRGRPPLVKNTDIPFSVEGKNLILVDDVLFTGRSARAAMDALIDYGRPRKIQLAVLIDRGHRELPIRADYVGKNVPTSPKERIHVQMKEEDGRDEISLQKL